ncbi:MAG: hypothetical protein AAGM67_19275, partial [Bacteroidota bacterium]
MLAEQLTYVYQRSQELIEEFCQLPHWRVWTMLIIAGIALLFAYPSYDLLFQEQESTNFIHLRHQFASPFEASEAAPESHQAKRVFRLSIPVLAKLSGISSPIVFIAIQHLLGLGFFLLGIRLAERLFEDRTSAFLLLIAIGGIYLGKSFFWDTRGWFDGFAFFALLLAMYSPNVLVQWSSLSFAFWTDERAILASGLVWIWWKLQVYGQNRLDLKTLIKPDRITLTFVLAWGSYLAIRLWLSQTYEMSVPMGKSGAIGFQRWELFLPALFTSLEGMSLLTIPIVVMMRKKSHIWQGLTLIFALLVVIIPAL